VSQGRVEPAAGRTAMASEAQWARRRIAYVGVAPLLMARSGAIGHAEELKNEAEGALI